MLLSVCIIALYCVSFSTADISPLMMSRWSATIESETVQSLSVEDDIVFAVDTKFAIGINASNGVVLWESAVADKRSAQSFTLHAARDMLVLVTSASILCLEARTGVTVWIADAPNCTVNAVFRPTSDDVLILASESRVFVVREPKRRRIPEYIEIASLSTFTSSVKLIEGVFPSWALMVPMLNNVTFVSFGSVPRSVSTPFSLGPLLADDGTFFTAGSNGGLLQIARWDILNATRDVSSVTRVRSGHRMEQLFFVPPLNRSLAAILCGDSGTTVVVLMDRFTLNVSQVIETRFDCDMPWRAGDDVLIAVTKSAADNANVTLLKVNLTNSACTDVRHPISGPIKKVWALSRIAVVVTSHSISAVSLPSDKLLGQIQHEKDIVAFEVIYRGSANTSTGVFADSAGRVTALVYVSGKADEGFAPATITSPITASGDALYFGISSPSEGPKAVAMDATTGRVIWMKKSGEMLALRALPVVVPFFSEPSVLFGDENGNVIALALKDGEQKAKFRSDIAATPIFSVDQTDNSIYIGAKGWTHVLRVAQNFDLKTSKDVEGLATGATVIGSAAVFFHSNELVYRLAKDHFEDSINPPNYNSHTGLGRISGISLIGDAVYLKCLEGVDVHAESNLVSVKLDATKGWARQESDVAPLLSMDMNLVVSTSGSMCLISSSDYSGCSDPNATKVPGGGLPSISRDGTLLFANANGVYAFKVKKGLAWLIQPTWNATGSEVGSCSNPHIQKGIAFALCDGNLLSFDLYRGTGYLRTTCGGITSLAFNEYTTYVAQGAQGVIHTVEFPPLYKESELPPALEKDPPTFEQFLQQHFWTFALVGLVAATSVVVAAGKLSSAQDSRHAQYQNQKLQEK